MEAALRGWGRGADGRGGVSRGVVPAAQCLLWSSCFVAPYVYNEEEKGLGVVRPLCGFSLL